jgi:hypothetical protein
LYARPFAQSHIPVTESLLYCSYAIPSIVFAITSSSSFGIVSRSGDVVVAVAVAVATDDEEGVDGSLPFGSLFLLRLRLLPPAPCDFEAQVLSHPRHQAESLK